jgi:guanylate cyclase 2F
MLPALTYMHMSSSSATKYLFSLQVDEGIEAMLCCWLQQLQEFGGPEVDKPDLLKGSIGSLRSHPQVKSAGSTSSLARNFLMDPKARYNVSTVMSMAS